MNNSLIFRSLIAALLICSAGSTALAQGNPAAARPAVAPPTDSAADDEQDEGDDDEDEDALGDNEQGDDELEGDDLEDGDDAQDEDDADTPEIEAVPAPASPLSDLASDFADLEFTPLEDIEEDILQSITPTKVYPYVDWSGSFRLRSNLKVNFDLETQGTSAVPPPVERFNTNTLQGREVVDADTRTLWSTNMRMRLEPRINITESLRLHIEADILDNVILGTQQADTTYFGVAGIDTRQPFIRVNEAWAELDAFFGTFRVGRMDAHWGLGIMANNGDCSDCSVEAPIDRVAFTTRLWDFYTRLTVDFPAEGPSVRPQTFGGQAYDAGQLDDANQYTIAIFKSALTRQDKELRAHQLKVEKKPVFDGGLYFIYRSQDGVFDAPAANNTSDLDRLDQGTLVYRGMQLYIPDLWFEVLYNPEPDMLLRASLELVGVFGSIDNASTSPVGISDAGDAVNCFDEDRFAENESLCTSQGSGLDRRDVSTDIVNLGVALETEMYLGGPMRYGLNGGYASGSAHNNWGLQSQGGNIVAGGPGAMQFYRFSPNYHVDLILFREVIGTVTNAFYANPWAQVRFWESPDMRSRMEVQLDAILSAAANPAGTPSAVVEDGKSLGGNRWLGLEFDAAMRYIESDHFQAEFAAGMLFPFAGLEPQINSQRLLPYGDQPMQYGGVLSPTFAWTLLANMAWQF